MLLTPATFGSTSSSRLGRLTWPSICARSTVWPPGVTKVKSAGIRSFAKFVQRGVHEDHCGAGLFKEVVDEFFVREAHLVALLNPSPTLRLARQLLPKPHGAVDVLLRRVERDRRWSGDRHGDVPDLRQRHEMDDRDRGSRVVRGLALRSGRHVRREGCRPPASFATHGLISALDISRRHIECPTDAGCRVEAGRPFTPFDHGQTSHGHLRDLRELLLGESSAFSRLPELLREGFFDLGRHSSQPTLRGPLRIHPPCRRRRLDRCRLLVVVIGAAKAQPQPLSWSLFGPRHGENCNSCYWRTSPPGKSLLLACAGAVPKHGGRQSYNDIKAATISPAQKHRSPPFSRCFSGDLHRLQAPTVNSGSESLLFRGAVEGQLAALLRLIRAEVTDRGWDTARLPAWVTAARVRAGLTGPTALAVFNASRDSTDHFAWKGSIHCDVSLLLDFRGDRHSLCCHRPGPRRAATLVSNCSNSESRVAIHSRKS